MTRKLLVSLCITCLLTAAANADFVESFTGGVINSDNGGTVVWSSSGDNTWGPGGSGLLAGDYFESGNISNNQTSLLTLTTEIRASGGLLGLDYAVGSEAGFDFFEIRINGNQVFSDSGLGSGSTGSFALAGGLNVIEFEYRKDGSVSSFSDSAGIDNVSVTGVVPEPSSGMILLAGAAAIAVRRKTR